MEKPNAAREFVLSACIVLATRTHHYGVEVISIFGSCQMEKKKFNGNWGDDSLAISVFNRLTSGRIPRAASNAAHLPFRSNAGIKPIFKNTKTNENINKARSVPLALCSQLFCGSFVVVNVSSAMRHILCNIALLTASQPRVPVGDAATIKTPHKKAFIKCFSISKICKVHTIRARSEHLGRTCIVHIFVAILCFHLIFKSIITSARHLCKYLFSVNDLLPGEPSMPVQR